MKTAALITHSHPPAATDAVPIAVAAGLVLFVLTFVVNAAARLVIERRKAFTE